MITVKKSKKVKCPHCGGKGLIFEIIDNGRDATWNKSRNEVDNEEQRIPNLTGTKEQCDEAKYIRARFVQIAKKHYQAELFKAFIKLISYESHSSFWIWNKDCKIAGLIAKIAVKNPTAFELIDRMR